MTEPRLFHGWRIVAVAFLTHCLTTGTVFYSFGVFFHPLSEQFGWSRSEISWGFSLTAIVGAVFAPFVGRFVDRFGPRPVQLFGASVLGLAFTMLGTIRQLWQFYACMGLLVAAGSTALGTIPSNTAVARWFIRRRGRALGMATAGISMGGVIFVPLTQLLIETVDWRGAFRVIGAIVVLVGLPPIALWMRSSPDEMGLLPDGDAPLQGVEAAEIAEEIEHSISARDAVRSRNFWFVSVAFALTVSSLSAILLHQIPHLIDQGMPPALAAWVLGGTAGVGVLGKLGFGALIDRLEHRRVVLLCFTLQAVGVALLFLPLSHGVLLAYVLVYGYSMGGNATLQATVLAECFGRLHYGAIAGRMSPIIVITQALGVPFVGWIHDRTGTYAAAFLVVIAATLIAAGCIMRIDFRAPGRGSR